MLSASVTSSKVVCIPTDYVCVGCSSRLGVSVGGTVPELLESTVIWITTELISVLYLAHLDTLGDLAFATQLLLPCR